MVLSWLKWFFVSLSVCSVLLAAYFMLSAKHSIKQVLDAVAIQAGSTIKNPDIKEYDGDNLSWRLQAQTAQEQASMVVLKKPVVELYTEQHELIPVQALVGFYDKKKDHIQLEGEVSAAYQDWVITTDKLDFYQISDEIQIKEAFVLQQEGMLITGKDMRILRKNGRISVLNGVHMRIEESR